MCIFIIFIILFFWKRETQLKKNLCFSRIFLIQKHCVDYFQQFWTLQLDFLLYQVVTLLYKSQKIFISSFFVYLK